MVPLASNEMLALGGTTAVYSKCSIMSFAN